MVLESEELQETEARMALRELRESAVSEDLKVNLAETVVLADKEIKVKEDPRDLMDSLDRMELQEIEESLVHKVAQDHLVQEVSQETVDKMDRQDHKVNPDHRELKASQDLLDLQEKEESEDQMDHQVIQGHQDLTEMLVETDQEGQMDLQDHRVHKESVDLQEKPDLKDLADLPVPEEAMDNQDRTELLENVDLRELQEQTVDQVSNHSWIFHKLLTKYTTVAVIKPKTAASTQDITVTGWARLNRSLSSARFYFELSGNSNYIVHCKSNYVQNFELEINSI